LKQLYKDHDISKVAKWRQTVVNLNEIEAANKNLKLFKYPLYDSLCDTSTGHPIITVHFTKAAFFKKSSNKRSDVFKKVNGFNHMRSSENGIIDRIKFPAHEIHMGHSIDHGDFQCSELFTQELLKATNLVCQDSRNNCGIDKALGLFKRNYIRANCPNGALVVNCIIFDPTSSDSYLLSESGRSIPKYLSSSICYEVAKGKVVCLSFLMENKNYNTRMLPDLVVDLEEIESLTKFKLFAGFKREDINQVKKSEVKPLYEKSVASTIWKVFGISMNKLIPADNDFAYAICQKSKEYAVEVEERLVCLDDFKFHSENERFRTKQECDATIKRQIVWIAGLEKCAGCYDKINGKISRVEAEGGEDDLSICVCCNSRLRTGCIALNGTQVTFKSYSLRNGRNSPLHSKNLIESLTSWVQSRSERQSRLQNQMFYFADQLL